MSQRPLRVVQGQPAEGLPSGIPGGLDFDDFYASESEDLFRRLWLVTTNDNEPAQRMFRAAGFRPTMLEMTRNAERP